jgi:hypothetical protein
MKSSVPMLYAPNLSMVPHTILIMSQNLNFFFSHFPVNSKMTAFFFDKVVCHIMIPVPKTPVYTRLTFFGSACANLNVDPNI